MNMSEEVTAVTLQVTEKAASTALQTASALLDNIGRLLRELLAIQREKQQIKGNQSQEKVRGTDLTDIKPGKVEVKDLIASAKRTGDSITVSEQGLTQEDVKAITQKARKYGIPVAFTNTDGKDNIFANVRTADLPIFKQIFTECIKETIAERPQMLKDFKCQAWEVPFLIAELKAHDLSAHFFETPNGEQICFFEKKDRKAVLLARDEFIRKNNEVLQDFSVRRDDNGFYILQDQHSGKEISFDEIPDRETLSERIQSAFGYDEIKAKLASAQFGEKMLSGEQRKRYFSDIAQDKFSEVAANIRLESDSILTTPYACCVITAKTDQIQRVVFRNNETGEFAVLRPDKQTRRQMREALIEQLGITDRWELDALVEKAERVHAHRLGQKNDLYIQTTHLHKADFDLSVPEVASAMRRVNENGIVLTKQQPIDMVENNIERTGEDSFKVVAFISSTEWDEQNNSYPSVQSEQIELSLSNKRKALSELTGFYKKQGVPEDAAKLMAKEVFRRASLQSIEKVVQIQEVRANSVVLSHGSQTSTVPTADKQEAIDTIARECGVSEDAAAVIVDKADEIKQDAQKPTDALADAVAPTESQPDLNQPKVETAQPVSRQTPAGKKPEWEQYFTNPQILAGDRQFDGTSYLKKSPGGGSFLLSDPLPDGTYYVMLRRDQFTGDYPFYESGTNLIDQYFTGAELEGGQITAMTPARVKPVPFQEGEFQLVEKGTITQEEAPDLSAEKGSTVKPPVERNGHEHHPEGDMLAGLKPDAAQRPSLPKPDPVIPAGVPNLPPPPSVGGRR